MNTGQYISGAGHIGLIGWLLFGGSFAADPLPFEVTDVTVISTADYEAMLAGELPPATASGLAPPSPPAPPVEQEVEQEPPARVRPPAELPPVTQEPEVVETPVPDDAPDVSQLTPPPEAEVDPTPPELARPPEEVAVIVPAPIRSVRPQARPAPRVAPTPVAQPEPETRVDEVVREDTAPDENAQTTRPEDEATAPEEAVAEVVPEADDKVSAAPTRSVRPQTRPRRAAPAETAQQDPTSDAVNDALAEALSGGTEDAAPDPGPAPTGPPLTRGEQEGLRLAVSRCWNVGALSTEALATTIVVGVRMGEDAKPTMGSIRLLSHSGGSAAAAKQAFEAARRAILRCGARGFDLPVEKYDHWRDIEMTFNSEKMR
ncbi:MAG: energy transducer TonB [Rhodobacterales bacterium]|nr:MAG: energy transducer TonB [Rhodobacterales bacterium]